MILNFIFDTKPEQTHKKVETSSEGVRRKSSHHTWHDGNRKLREIGGEKGGEGLLNWGREWFSFLHRSNLELLIEHNYGTMINCFTSLNEHFHWQIAVDYAREHLEGPEDIMEIMRESFSLPTSSYKNMQINKRSSCAWLPLGSGKRLPNRERAS